MRTIWHIFKKDLRRFRWEIIVLVVFLATKVLALEYLRVSIEANNLGSAYRVNAMSQMYDIIQIYPYNSIYSIYGLTDSMNDSLNSFKPIVFVYLFFLDGILVLYIAVNSLKEDSAFETLSFWRSRPVSRGQMLAAKALFIGIVAFALPSLAQIAYSNLSLLNPIPSENWRFFENQLQCLAIQSDWVALAVLLATLWRSQIVGGIVLGAIGFAISFFIFQFASRAYLFESDTLLIFARWGALIIAAAMYLRGDRKVGFGLLGTLAVVMIAFGFFT